MHVIPTRLFILTTALAARGEEPIPEEAVDLLFKLNSKRNDAAQGSVKRLIPSKLQH